MQVVALLKVKLDYKVEQKTKSQTFTGGNPILEGVTVDFSHLDVRLFKFPPQMKHTINVITIRSVAIRQISVC